MENRPWQRHYDYNVPLTIRYPRVPAHYFLNIPAGNFPNKPATNFYGTEITFWDLRQQVLRMANALGEMGVKKGDRIGVHLPNCPQYIIAYYAALNLGAVVVNLNPMYTVDELKALTSDTGVSALFTFDLVLPNIRPAVPGSGYRPGCRYAGDRLHRRVRTEHSPRNWNWKKGGIIFLNYWKMLPAPACPGLTYCRTIRP